jgi:magnesium transporter
VPKETFFAYVLHDGAAERTTKLDDVKAAQQAGWTVWLHIYEQSTEVDALLEKTFGIHALAIEDIWNEGALPKIEDFEEYLYVRVHGLSSNASLTDLELLELDLVLGRTFVISHHHGHSLPVMAVEEECARSNRLLKKGAVWLAHALLDHLIDHYLPIIEKFDDAIAEVEDAVLKHAGRPQGRKTMARIFALKRVLHRLRRTSGYQREILLRLSRAEFDEIPREAMPFFRDIYDHFARVTDLTDGHRELVSGALEAYLSIQSNRMNEVMKTLTLMSTVMLPLTFVAGIYGMNFQFMPELGWKYGYAFALGLMAFIAVAIMTWFRHKKWT